MNDAERFGTWAIVELMGHRRLAGYLTEQQIAGAGFLRLDIPESDATEETRLASQAATQFYAPSSVYAITPVTEEVARAVARRARPEPVHYYELQLPAAKAANREDEDEDEDPLDDFTDEELADLRRGRG